MHQLSAANTMAASDRAETHMTRGVFLITVTVTSTGDRDRRSRAESLTS